MLYFFLFVLIGLIFPDLVLAEPISLTAGTLATISTVASAASALATIGTSIAGATRSPGKSTVIQAPTEAEIAAPTAEIRRKRLAGRGFRETILSDLATQHGGGLKSTFGQ
jgi:hypothetical protein